MSIDLSHLLDSYRACALLPNEERIQWIKQNRWIHYSRAERVLDCLTALLHYPPRDYLPCLLLFGATGTGKTSLAATTGRASMQVLAELARSVYSNAAGS